MYNFVNKMQWQQLVLLSFASIFGALLIRLVGYFYTNNLALALETAHITFDVVLTLFILATIRVTKANFTKNLPYGFFKLEDLITLLIAVLIVYFSVDFIVSGFEALPGFSTIAALFELVSVIPLYIAGYLKIKAGNILHSPSLRADGRHTYTDVYEGLGVATGLLIYGYTHIYLFYVLAILIAFGVLMFTAYSIAKEALLGLLDLPKDKNTMRKVIDIAEHIEGVRKVKEARLRWAGPVIFVELVVEMNPLMTIDEAHPITEVIENRIKEEVESVKSVTVHVEPVERKEFKILVPVMEQQADARVSSVLGKSPYFALVELTKEQNGYKSKISYIENAFKAKDHIGPDFKNLVEREKVTDIICKSVGEGIYGVICSHSIYCWKSKTGRLDTDLLLYEDKKLQKTSIS